MTTHWHGRRALPEEIVPCPLSSSPHCYLFSFSIAHLPRFVAGRRWLIPSYSIAPLPPSRLVHIFLPCSPSSLPSDPIYYCPSVMLCGLSLRRLVDTLGWVSMFRIPRVHHPSPCASNAFVCILTSDVGSRCVIPASGSQ